MLRTIDCSQFHQDSVNFMSDYTPRYLFFVERKSNSNCTHSDLMLPSSVTEFDTVKPIRRIGCMLL